MIYEYRCDQCQQVFTVRATIAEKEAGLRPTCPQCGSANSRQVFSAAFLKGVGAAGGTPAGGCGPGAMPGCCPF